MSADVYYEVLRLIDGQVLFYRDHLERFQQSLEGTGIPFPGEEFIRRSLSLLIRYNPFENGNIRICIQKQPGKEADCLCYFIPYVYPEPAMYREGVALKTYKHTRPNPGIKKWDDAFRKGVNRFIREQGIYEAVLLNHRERITEGSRSNIFFLDSSNNLYTAPLGEVLSGITRKYILEICREARIPVFEQSVKYRDLGSMESCFLSGTSPKVLPVNRIDNLSFSVQQELLRVLMKKFDELMLENLESL